MKKCLLSLRGRAGEDDGHGRGEATAHIAVRVRPLHSESILFICLKTTQSGRTDGRSLGRSPPARARTRTSHGGMRKREKRAEGERGQTQESESDHAAVSGATGQGRHTTSQPRGRVAVAASKERARFPSKRKSASVWRELKQT